MIIRYDGWRNKNGEIGDKTAVVWRCQKCGIESRSRYGMIRTYIGGTEICRMCTRWGPPRTTKQVKLKYPCILKALTFDKRGGIYSGSIILAKCRSCRVVQKTLFQHIVRIDGDWRCKSCARREQFNKKLLLPSNLPKEVAVQDIKTLGKNGSVVAHTKISTACFRCGRIFIRDWSNYTSNPNALCKSCVTGIRWESNEYREQYSRMMKRKWLEPKARDNFLKHRKDSGHFSGLHRRVKQLLDALGLTAFRSEQLVDKFRVDELCEERKIILEIYGDYWHFNPKLYGPEWETLRNGLKITATQKWEEDQKRLKRLNFLGYKVYIIWGKDFETDQKKCMEDFKEWLSSQD